MDENGPTAPLGQEIDPWRPPGPAEQAAEPQEREFAFTAGYADTSFDLALTHRVKTLRGVRAERVTLSLAGARHRIVRMRASSRVHRLAVHGRQNEVTPVPGRRRGMARRAVEFIRERGPCSLETLVQHVRVWTGAAHDLDVRALPHTFVRLEDGTVALTPWMALDVPFHTSHTAWGYGEYNVREAVRFWLEYQHQPTPEEEFSAAVRERVAELLHLQPALAYFREASVGPFVQATPHGPRFFQLDFDRLPDGNYFQFVSPHGTLVFSMGGRAFLMDGPGGVSVVTGWAMRRFEEALRGTEGVRVEWVGEGVAFRAAMDAAGLTLKPQGR